MAASQEKFITRVEMGAFAATGQIPTEENWQRQAVVEDALKVDIEQRSKSEARSHVMTAYRSSLEHYGVLYEKLAN